MQQHLQLRFWRARRSGETSCASAYHFLIRFLSSYVSRTVRTPQKTDNGMAQRNYYIKKRQFIFPVLKWRAKC